MAEQTNPRESHQALLGEALLLDRQGRISEAIAAYERLLESWPALPDCWYNLAVLQRRTTAIFGGVELVSASP